MWHAAFWFTCYRQVLWICNSSTLFVKRSQCLSRMSSLSLQAQVTLCNKPKPCFSSWLLFPIFIGSTRTQLGHFFSFYCKGVLFCFPNIVNKVKGSYSQVIIARASPNSILSYSKIKKINCKRYELFDMTNDNQNQLKMSIALEQFESVFNGLHFQLQLWNCLFFKQIVDFYNSCRSWRPYARFLCYCWLI